ncbi:MFS transporter [Cohnella caldifontis]|uniref:MFS transporter n=1 Tax=Cohnella caldifontis TaxID=3027471 RepID=UPI0023ED3336|nr:MFS transporter [Cohnella sp. YIM B05605]
MGLKSRISLLFLAVTATFGTMIAAPVVKLLAVAFPETDRLLIQWIVTISSLFILPTLFMASYLARNFPRKNILIVGLLLYIVGGIGPALSSSFTVILLFRAIMGISIGLISPAFNSLIAENFQGRERAKMNGYVISITGIGGAVFLPIGGEYCFIWMESGIPHVFICGDTTDSRRFVSPEIFAGTQYRIAQQSVMAAAAHVLCRCDCGFSDNYALFFNPDHHAVIFSR